MNGQCTVEKLNLSRHNREYSIKRTRHTILSNRKLNDSRNDFDHFCPNNLIEFLKAIYASYSSEIYKIELATSRT